MSPARSRPLAWGLGAFGVLLAPVAFVLQVVAIGSVPTIFLEFLICFAAVQLTTTAIGAVVAARLPHNRVGWILLAIGIGLGFRQLFGAYGLFGNVSPSGPLPGDDIAAWLGEWTFTPAVAGGAVFLLHLFPDGRFMSRRWKLVCLAGAGLVALVTAADALQPGPLDSIELVRNPVGATGSLADVVDVIVRGNGWLAPFAFGTAVVGIVVRLRRAHGIQREQIKWVTAACVIVGLGLCATAVFPDSAVYPLLASLLALAAMPLAVGVAMLRHRLYDIDVVINRTLVYGALTATLAGIYLGSVLVLQLVLSGVTSGSGLAVAVSTLAVAAVFRPARMRIQEAVDRRFYRSKYDAARTLERFSGRLRDEVDLDALGTGLRAVVMETMQPAHVSLWLREAGR
ncbi:MAG: hypothetical protein QOG15_211 [Solirubrobacteraceae bacterium]|jgi:hypothetical protein|nr:hypothetical protein [Solirubrobacteraceae bacterium]